MWNTDRRAVATIQQKISAGGNFDGTLPAGAPATADYVKKYAAEAVGGLFSFGFTSAAVAASIELKLADQTSWSIHKKDAEGIELLLWAGTTETDFVTVAQDEIVMTEGQELLLRTVGATTAMTARMSVREV